MRADGDCEQPVIEGVMLSSAASVMGVALAKLTLRALRARTARAVRHLHGADAEPAGAGGAAGADSDQRAGSSVWPAISAARAPIEPALRQGAVQRGTGRRQHRLRAVLVVAEIAMSLTLLVACGLLLRTINTLRHVPPGFRTDHVVVASMTIPSYRYRTGFERISTVPPRSNHVTQRVDGDIPPSLSSGA